MVAVTVYSVPSSRTLSEVNLPPLITAVCWGVRSVSSFWFLVVFAVHFGLFPSATLRASVVFFMLVLVFLLHGTRHVRFVTLSGVEASYQKGKTEPTLRLRSA